MNGLAPGSRLPAHPQPIMAVLLVLSFVVLAHAGAYQYSVGYSDNPKMMLNRDKIVRAKDVPEPDRLEVRSILIIPRMETTTDESWTKTRRDASVMVIRDTATGLEYLVLIGDGQIVMKP